ncbi:MAG TPA: ankyrin repeat domain-containing protein [Chitinophagaceae bacterium]|nr:ankyrin repeat domain-containing protein [Chitinophagaceae bacterium]
MIQPQEMKLNLPMVVANNVVSTTTKVWNILVASRNGNLEEVKHLVNECPELIYAQYNYTPPIHFAVREGHLELVKYLLDNGAHDPKYRSYPFSEYLQTIAQERNYNEITLLLEQYADDPSKQKFKGDNGEIHYNRSELQLEFQEAVNKSSFSKTEKILKDHPEFTKDETYFWGEGILVFAAKENNRKMIDLLMSYGAKVPNILKWAQFYYFERLDGASYMMEKGMNPNVMSWHHVTLLHDIAQKGDIQKAELLIKYGADMDPVEEEYQSTPLGMAVKWGHPEMVNYLLTQGANPNKAGASWATPIAWAKKKGHSAIEKILLLAGAK